VANDQHAACSQHPVNVQLWKVIRFDAINLLRSLLLLVSRCHYLKPVFVLYLLKSTEASARSTNALCPGPQVIWGECIAGALYINDFLRIAKEAGFVDPRILHQGPVAIHDHDIQVLCQEGEPLVMHTAFYKMHRVLQVCDLQYRCQLQVCITARL
jgi:arsenite methyltransferase